MSIFLVIFGIVASYAIQTNMKISKYEMGNIDQMIEQRTQTFGDGEAGQGGGLTMLYKLPEPLRFILNIPVQVIRPLSIKDPFKAEFDHRLLGYAITTLSLIILIGYYLRGLIIGIFTKDKNVRFFLYTLILYASIIGYLSFLDRNRIIMIPLFPTLIALNYTNYSISRKEVFILFK